jgi:hypothetical protein
MFADHQPQLSRLGRSGPEGMVRIATFAMLTARVHLHDAVRDYPLVRAGQRTKLRSVFAWKHVGLEELEARGPEIYECAERLYQGAKGEELEDGLLNIFTSVFGLGLAKAGFIAQMIYGVSGCIDTHNLERFDLPISMLKLNGASVRRASKMIHKYNQVCRDSGGTQALWDTWCCYLADRDVNYPDADYVSRLHLTPLSA